MPKNEISEKALRKLATAGAEIELATARDSGELGFTARALALASLPHSKPKEQEVTRINGDLQVTLLAQKKVGLPYGVIPRLVICWLATEVVKTQSREVVLGDSMSSFMRELDMLPTGGRWGSIKRFKDQTEKLFRCNIDISRVTHHEEHQATQEEGVSFPLAEKREFWWSYDPNQENLFQSSVTLSKSFYDELVNNPLPIDLRALKALRKSPMAIDIYTWLTLRLYTVKKPVLVTWKQLQGQFGSAYPTTTEGRSNFKKNFLKQLKKVRVVYPGANISESKGKAKGLLLKSSKTSVGAIK